MYMHAWKFWLWVNNKNIVAKIIIIKNNSTDFAERKFTGVLMLSRCLIKMHTKDLNMVNFIVEWCCPNSGHVHI